MTNQLQLEKLKRQLESPNDEDELLNDILENASDIICDIRNSDKVEKKYLSSQISIAIELYNKRGAEGQTSHGENGISRSYEKGDVSPSLISRITPIAKTPWSKVRVVE